MRADVSVDVEKFAGDGFVTRSRKKPVSLSQLLCKIVACLVLQPSIFLSNVSFL